MIGLLPISAQTQLFSVERAGAAIHSFQNKITKRDGKGRPVEAKMVTQYGTCMSEVVYDPAKKHPPEIHVVIIKRLNIRHPGYYVFNEFTEETMPKEFLESYMEKIAEEVCLPFLLPGYQKV